jgi:hypothetical protein
VSQILLSCTSPGVRPYISTFTSCEDHLVGVKITMGFFNAEDHGIDPWSGKMKHYWIGICCFSSKRTESVRLALSKVCVQMEGLRKIYDTLGCHRFYYLAPLLVLDPIYLHVEVPPSGHIPCSEPTLQNKILILLL